MLVFRGEVQAKQRLFGLAIMRMKHLNDMHSHWHFPATHYLESWGDAITSDGTLVPIQPLIQPLFGGLTELEFLARIAGESKTNPYEIVRETNFFGRCFNASSV